MHWKALITMAVVTVVTLIVLHNFGPASLKAQTGTV